MILGSIFEQFWEHIFVILYVVVSVPGWFLVGSWQVPGRVLVGYW